MPPTLLEAGFAAVDVRLALPQASGESAIFISYPIPGTVALQTGPNVPGFVGVLGTETRVLLTLQTVNPSPRATDIFSVNKQTTSLVPGSCARHGELGGIMRTDRIPGHGARKKWYLNTKDLWQHLQQRYVEKHL